MSLPKIARCRKCGAVAVLYRDTEPYASALPDNDGLFSIYCEGCGEQSSPWCRPERAIREWNAANAVPAQEGGSHA